MLYYTHFDLFFMAVNLEVSNNLKVGGRFLCSLKGGLG